MKTKKLLSLILTVVIAFGMFTGCGSQQTSSDSTSDSKKEVTLNALFMKQAGYSESDVKAITDEFQQKNPNIKVQLTFVPYESLEQKILTAAPTGGYDVVCIDAPWTAKFAKAGIVKDITSKLSDGDRSDIFTGAIDAVSYQDKLYGMPWLNDTKYLFYNKEMLTKAGIKEAPKTWDELIADAKIIKDKGIVKYPLVWSWAQAEALVCDYTSLTGSFGGAMVDKDGKPSFTTSQNKKALDLMYQSIKDGLTNPSSLEFLEEDVRGTFSSGKAAFALNWTYMFNMANDPKESQIVGKVGIAPIPGSDGITSASVNGGMGLSITAGSQNDEAAWTYIQYLSSKDVQKKYAKNALPIWKSLYEDKDVVATGPDVVKAAKVQYEYLVNRPRVPWYGELSTEIQVQVQKVLQGKTSSDAALKALQDKANSLANQ